MSAPTAVQQAANALRAWIEQGVVDGGPALPGEIALAQRLKVSRGTVRQVLAQLTADGLITARRHRGRKVRSPVAVGAEQAVVMIGGGLDQAVPATYEGAVEDACVRTLRARRYPLLVVNGGHTLPSHALALLGRRPLGIIVAQFLMVQERWAAQARAWAEAGIPVVVHSHDAAHAAFDRVASDHQGGCRALVAALIAQGRRRILPVWHTDARPAWLQQREAGWRQAVEDAGLAPLEPVRPLVMKERSSQEDPRDLDLRARGYLGFLFDRLRGPEAPDALLAVNDTHAWGVAGACRLLGLAVHAQVAVAGFDANWGEHWDLRHGGIPPLLTVSKRNHRVGEALVEVLEERLARGPGGAPIHRLLPVEVERGGG